MKEKRLSFFTLMSALILLFAPISAVSAADNIVIGCPLSTAFLYGWDAEKGVKLAVEEINAQGGVNVGGKKLPFKVEVIDTRDLEPGVPVSDALMAVEKLILEKKADFIIGGPVRSEAALSAMDLLGKYKKVSILTTGVLTPRYHARVAEEYNKLKYCFRIHGEVGTARQRKDGLLRVNSRKSMASTKSSSWRRMSHTPEVPEKVSERPLASKDGQSQGRRSILLVPRTSPWDCSRRRVPKGRCSVSGWTCRKALSF